MAGKENRLTLARLSHVAMSEVPPGARDLLIMVVESDGNARTVALPARGVLAIGQATWKILDPMEHERTRQEVSGPTSPGDV
jgi:hypothetical protein